MTEQKFQELVEKTGGYPFGVNEWGSCQYTGALNMFITLETLLKKGKRRPGGAAIVTEEVQNDRARGFALSKLGLAVSYSQITPIEEAWKVFRKEMTDHYKGFFYDAADRKKIRQDFIGLTPSVDAMFAMTRDHAWDLWTAAPFIARLMFKELVVAVPDAPGRGPSMNVAAQNENYVTGLYCWLLWNHKLVKDESSFKGFDT